MIFCKDLLFLHVPKTGGRSVSNYLLKVLPRPIYYSHPKSDIIPITERQTDDESGVIHVVGDQHESLVEAINIVRSFGFDISKIPMIIAVIRNPYDLEVSRYSYLQQFRFIPPGDESHAKNQLLAIEDFEKFAIESMNHAGNERPVESYFLLNEMVPRNLRIIKFENLYDDLIEALHEIGISEIETLPHINRSRHGEYHKYYTRLAEDAVYRRYKWVFDSGYYERLDHHTFPFLERAPFNGENMPISGPVHPASPPIGLWGDLWVGEELLFRVVVEQPVTRVVVEGRFVHEFRDPVPIKIQLNGITSLIHFSGSGPFRWAVPCNVSGGAEVELVLSVGKTWRPIDVGKSIDERRLSFLLKQVSFDCEGC